ncbi:hypothetical protein B0I35DRAFT_409240 [Stachybotrys elegans]|uniref:Uncharacterized protein n=1 Tax=Stachybotrys elegans TaxID=80388 RepID=A0A8K0SPU5_9HYPO|nr:hypothetical protein B0I35DRAFT_409240 [Stachybotrys elegans]
MPPSHPSSVNTLKLLIIPAVISLLLFLVLTFVIVPVWRYYRTRYGQYLPLDTITSHTLSWRQRIHERMVQAAIASSNWRRDRANSDPSGGVSDIDLEDGEELDSVDQATRAAIERQSRTSRPDNSRRLSRDLEAVFADDSDEETEPRRGR